MMPRFLVILLFITSCGPKSKTISPSIRDITESVYASGMVKSKNQYRVFSMVSGIVQDVLVDENELVKIGTPLFTIGNDQQKLLEKNAELTNKFNSLAINEGKLEEAKALVSLAKQKMENDEVLLQRQRALWDQGIGTKVELEQKELTLLNSKTAYASAQQKFADLKNQLSYAARQAQNNLKIISQNSGDYVVKSKIDGKVYQINTNKGEWVTPQAPLALLGDNKIFFLEMQVDEYDIVSIKNGMSVFIEMNSYPDSIFKARIIKINPIMNDQTKTFTVEAEFISQPEILYPFISFEANILLKSKAKALIIPRNCIKNDSIVVLSDGTEKVVKTGIKDYEMIEIISGLTIHDKLIIPQ